MGVPGSERTMLDSDLLTVRDVAQFLKVDDSTVQRWIKEGLLPAIPLPRRGKRTMYRVRQASVENMLLTPPAPTV